MISYKPLFRTIKEKGVGLTELGIGIGISSTVTAKFDKNENVSLDTISKICIYLDVPIEQVVEVIRDK